MNRQMQQAQEMLNLLIPKTAALSPCCGGIGCLWGTWKHRALHINTWNGFSRVTPGIWEKNPHAFPSKCVGHQVRGKGLLRLSSRSCLCRVPLPPTARTRHACGNKEPPPSASADHSWSGTKEILGKMEKGGSRWMEVEVGGSLLAASPQQSDCSNNNGLSFLILS